MKAWRVAAVFTSNYEWFRVWLLAKSKVAVLWDVALCGVLNIARDKHFSEGSFSHLGPRASFTLCPIKYYVCVCVCVRVLYV